MKILFLTTAFNGMAQRAWIELDRLDHQVKVQIAHNGEVMKAAVEEFQPNLILAPFLKKKIPASIWQNYMCWIIHPGIKGDRGSSSLDWAILREEKEWGVTLLQAVEKMDAGPVWAEKKFPMRSGTKASLYRNEVTQAAMAGLLESLDKLQHSSFQPEVPNSDDPTIRGTWRPSCKQEDYQFSWTEPATQIIKKIEAADSDPGVLISLFDTEYYAYGAHLEETLSGEPKNILAQRNKSICLGTGNQAVWITHLKENIPHAIKLPSSIALGRKAEQIPTSSLNPFDKTNGNTYREIKYEEEAGVGYLHFDFYNGAMSTDQCRRLKEAIIEAKKKSINILCLMGGQDLWSNGIHLNIIEHADNPADASWENIQAIDDLILEIIQSPNHYIISALQGNAGAGGVPFALAGDKVLARSGIVLNPHTRNMGLYGSEYWTYLLPKRIGKEKATMFTEQCLPWGTAVAKEIGLIDEVIEASGEILRNKVKEIARGVLNLPYFEKLLMAKRQQRRKDNRVKPLEAYRKEELERMHKNFYENDQAYEEKRFRFVHKILDEEQGLSVEQKDWYSSRRKIYRRRKWETIEYEG